MKHLIYLLFLTIFTTVGVNAQLKFLNKDVNSKYQDFRPVVSADGHYLFFTVEGNPINKYKDGQDIWLSERTDSGKWGKAERLPDYINCERYNGVFWSSPDGNRIIIRGAKDGTTNGIIRRGYSIVSKFNGVWGTPQPIKIRDYNKLSLGKFTGVTLSPDEKVMIFYFDDERNGDWNDLWFSFLNDTTNEYSTPIMLTELSNEDEDEISPYIAPDNETLYYSTNKKGGVGYFDIWMTRRVDSTWLHWSKPVNLGKPINTKRWDAYFSIGENDSIAYVSSNFKYSLRGEKGGSDIATTTIPELFRPKVRKLKIEPKIDTVVIRDTIVITKTIPCDPLDTMSNENLIKEYNKGRILFDFGSSVLRPEAYHQLDIVIRLIRNNPEAKIEIGGHTDAIGQDKRNELQSEERAISVKSYLIGKGIKPESIKTIGYGNKKPIMPNNNDGNRQLNRRVEIKFL
jgi:outer membrane protein OmpA-like peptidoglycan-associated protein